MTPVRFKVGGPKGPSPEDVAHATDILRVHMKNQRKDSHEPPGTTTDTPEAASLWPCSGCDRGLLHSLIFCDLSAQVGLNSNFQPSNHVWQNHCDQHAHKGRNIERAFCCSLKKPPAMIKIKVPSNTQQCTLATVRVFINITVEHCSTEFIVGEARTCASSSQWLQSVWMPLREVCKSNNCKHANFREGLYDKG
mmetsp:Transcript_77134/g.226246  ORF Transcript_77134/g.226246 Transcript_77134/m.226246 type:complete len:194 (+) Transcript_77134:518-1099(+)